MVAPVRERGLKYQLYKLMSQSKSRSREGAWIEILRDMTKAQIEQVAPVRERGLK